MRGQNSFSSASPISHWPINLKYFEHAWNADVFFFIRFFSFGFGHGFLCPEHDHAFQLHGNVLFDYDGFSSETKKKIQQNWWCVCVCSGRFWSPSKLSDRHLLPVLTPIRSEYFHWMSHKIHFRVGGLMFVYWRKREMRPNFLRVVSKMLLLHGRKKKVPNRIVNQFHGFRWHELAIYSGTSVCIEWPLMIHITHTHTHQCVRATHWKIQIVHRFVWLHLINEHVSCSYTQNWISSTRLWCEESRSVAVITQNTHNLFVLHSIRRDWRSHIAQISRCLTPLFLTPSSKQL